MIQLVKKASKRKLVAKLPDVAEIQPIAGPDVDIARNQMKDLLSGKPGRPEFRLGLFAPPGGQAK